jgi:transcriptional accessory protein Tex/SPT6
MTDYETIRKDIYESFHDIFHKLYISELKDQIADKDEVITANDHVIAEQQAEIERLRAALRDVLSYVPHGDMPVTIYDNARAVLEGK